MKKKIALFPGSFDPITNAHVDVITRALSLFDEIHIAIGMNSAKTPLLTLQQRLTILQEIFHANHQIKVGTYEGLTVDYCKKIQAHYILRGLRNGTDFDFENAIAQNNLQLAPSVETVLFFSSPSYSHISSTIVRDILKNNGSIAHLVPKEVLDHI
ncbi:pantetheine-phosphate adenylyltransferase [Olivibacter ginsenosidimutans]|uniref:Phosphopantetheine adenylyltransferase n=1 Tax=Olivibacter ginsenosidimutans TaxID=1176537 RepID=A0ABP9B1S9_9SPHI